MTKRPGKLLGGVTVEGAGEVGGAVEVGVVQQDGRAAGGDVNVGFDPGCAGVSGGGEGGEGVFRAGSGRPTVSKNTHGTSMRQGG